MFSFLDKQNSYGNVHDDESGLEVSSPRDNSPLVSVCFQICIFDLGIWFKGFGSKHFKSDALQISK